MTKRPNKEALNAALRFPVEEYLSWSPDDGDKDDSGVRNRTVRLVKARKEHRCWMAPLVGEHSIQPGELYVREKVVLDGEWCTAHACIKCVEREIAEYRGELP